MRTWIVGHDFSPQGHEALTTALRLLSESGGGRLVVLHVHDPASEGFGTELTVPWGAGLDVAGSFRAEAERDLAKDLANIAAPGVEIAPVVVTGHVADEFLRYANTVDAELIVVGSHGRKGLERWLLGSVAERIVRQAGRSVLVVKHAPTVDNAHP